MSLSLLTDLYQLTMAYGYWKHGMHDQHAAFNLFFRKAPFDNSFAIVAGTEKVIEFLSDFGFDQSDIDYLRTLQGTDNKQLFEDGFLDYLSTLKFTCSVNAAEEGTVVFPHEPMLTVCGPLAQCQLVETPLLNIMNFQTLIATKAYRVCAAAQGPVLEFGLRRAQGFDGALSASRAAYIGGCSATSNVLAGKMYGIPIKGTHAHSWVMSFDSEQKAFDKYAEVMPNNSTLLVDTYDTIKGVCAAVETGKLLRRQGSDLAGIRLDSGNLLELSKTARKILDAFGFQNTKIVVSNDLDEYEIQKLKNQNAPIDIWGVGTRLVTAYDQPALGGVYKLGAIRDVHGHWHGKLKKSNDPAKTSNPGLLQVYRFQKGLYWLDVMTNTLQVPFSYDIGTCEYIQGSRYSRYEVPNFEYASKMLNCNILLAKIFDDGNMVYTVPTLNTIREKVQKEVKLFPPEYPIILDTELTKLKKELLKND